MTTLADLPFIDGRESPPTPTGAGGVTCGRHRWEWTEWAGADSRVLTMVEWCSTCHKPRNPAASRRGRSSDRLGKDQERRIERVYGPRKVGEYGDAVDHLGRDFKWQAKATRKAPPKWLAAIVEPTWRPILPKSILVPMAHMAGIGGMRRPLVIRSYVHQGLPTRDWLLVVGIDWFRLHGTAFLPASLFGYLVIPGADFLMIHGRDEETTA